MLDNLYQLYSTCDYIGQDSLPHDTIERKALYNHLKKLSDVAYQVYKNVDNGAGEKELEIESGMIREFLGDDLIRKTLIQEAEKLIIDLTKYTNHLNNL